MKRCLVTGGAGFIGLHLARHLSDEGRQVTILDNFARAEDDAEFKDIISRDHVDFVKGDVTAPETFARLDGKYDHVYHLAAINGTGNFYKIPDQVLRVGVLGTLNILDWFCSQGHGKILFSSSSETYAGALKVLGDAFPIPTPEEVPFVVDDPANVRWSYGAGKMVGEVAFHAYARARNMKNFSIIRYHNIYGPRMGFEHVIPQFVERIVKKEDPFTIYGGEETRTFCHVKDAVRATRMVMEAEGTAGGTYHLGRSDGEIKIIDLARNLFDIAGVNPDIDVKQAPEGSVQRRCPDVSRLDALGFSPEVDLDAGLRETYDWYRTRV